MSTTTILRDLTPSALAYAIEQNAIEGCLAWSAWPRMELHHEPDMLFTMTDIPFSLFNNVFRARFSTGEIDTRIDLVLGHARSQQVPVAWWTGPSTRPPDLETHLERKGFILAGTSPAMAVNLLFLKEGFLRPRDLSITEVDDIETLGAWNQIVTSVFEFPEFARQLWLEMYASLGLGSDKPWRHFIAWLDDMPVAASSLFLGAGVASVSNVATLLPVRRRGIGTAITLHPLREARSMGYRIGTLWSSEIGRSVYERLGFREYATGRFHVWMKD